MRALLIGLAASFALAVPAQARSAETVSISIPYRDLDVTTAAGIKAFRQRSIKAIRIACAKLATDFVFASTSESSCRADALAQAMQQIEEKRRTTLALLTGPTG
jgi:UrcA family protein